MEPNEWRDKGEKWIAFALSKSEWKVGETYDVAYISHIPIKIKQKERIHEIMPTYWDLKQIPDGCNFYLGTPGTFRLNGKYYNTIFKTIGSKKNVDLSPIEDKNEILNLLKKAEKIYNPTE